jgi:hypothetical protein
MPLRRCYVPSRAVFGESVGDRAAGSNRLAEIRALVAAIRSPTRCAPRPPRWHRPAGVVPLHRAVHRLPGCATHRRGAAVGARLPVGQQDAHIIPSQTSLELPGRCGDWLAPPPSPPRAHALGRHDEPEVGTSNWLATSADRDMAISGDFSMGTARPAEPDLAHRDRGEIPPWRSDAHESKSHSTGPSGRRMTLPRCASPWSTAAC